MPRLRAWLFLFFPSRMAAEVIMRVDQISDAKAYAAAIGGFAVTGLSLDTWAVLLSVIISVMVIAEKTPVFVTRVKSLYRWSSAKISKVEAGNLPKIRRTPKFYISAVISIIVFYLLFGDLSYLGL